MLKKLTVDVPVKNLLACTYFEFDQLIVLYAYVYA